MRRRSASSTSPTSARPTVRGPGAATFVERLPDQRPRPDRAGQGAVHAVLRRRDRRRRRRPHRLPARRRRRLPDPQRGQHRRGGPAAGRGRPGGRHRGATGTRGSACSPCRDRARRGARRARAADRPRLHVASPRPSGAGAGGRRLPHRLHRRARLRAAAARGRRRRAVGRAARGGGEPSGAAVRARRPRHAAHRDGLPAARPGPVARRSRRCRPGSAGRSAGQAGRSGAATRCSPRRSRAPPAAVRAARRSIAASRARTWRCSRRPEIRSARSPAGRSRRPSGSASAWRCWTGRSPTATRSGRRPRPAVDDAGGQPPRTGARRLTADGSWGWRQPREVAGSTQPVWP